MRLIIAILLAGAAFGQTPPKFDVASVKPGNGPISDFRILPGGRLHVEGQTLNIILREAFALEPYQLQGGPSWLTVDRFEIDAKAEGEPTRQEMLTMLQNLLAERFNLKVHREQKEGNVFNLVVGKGGPKLQPPTGEKMYVGLYRNDPPTEPGVHYTIKGNKAPISVIAIRLAQEMHAPVIDRTGLTGEFDFKVDFAIGDDPGAGAPLLIAVQEQLGLKLEAAKGPVDTLIVDHVEKPTAN